MKSFFTAVAALASIMSLPSLVQAEIKGVFAHYLVAGMADGQSQADRDVQQAKNAGFDAFALNLFQVAGYSNDALNWLFTAAEQQGFKLFFSLDMNPGNLGDADPAGWAGKLNQYISSSAYYRVDGRPFLSTFNGGNQNFGQQASVDQAWQNIFNQYGLSGDNKPYFVPDFDDSDAYDGSDFFGTFPSLDGTFSWETAWPTVFEAGDVSNAKDASISQQARAASKVYMMPWSTLQFKDLSPIYQYRKGELNFAQRIQQILDVQPDYVELISWNDGGESHNIGQLAPATTYPYNEGLDHTGWLSMVHNVIYAMKQGATSASSIYPDDGVQIAGSAWYRTILTTSPCNNGKPFGSEHAVDAVNYAFVLPAGYGQVTVKVSSDGQYIGGTSSAQAGLNMQSVTGLTAGSAPTIEISDYLGNVFATWTGPVGVSNNGGDVCNYNYAVAAINAQ